MVLVARIHPAGGIPLLTPSSVSIALRVLEGARADGLIANPSQYDDMRRHLERCLDVANSSHGAAIVRVLPRGSAAGEAMRILLATRWANHRFSRDQHHIEVLRTALRVKTPGWVSVSDMNPQAAALYSPAGSAIGPEHGMAGRIVRSARIIMGLYPGLKDASHRATTMAISRVLGFNPRSVQNMFITDPGLRLRVRELDADADAFVGNPKPMQQKMTVDEFVARAREARARGYTKRQDIFRHIGGGRARKNYARWCGRIGDLAPDVVAYLEGAERRPATMTVERFIEIARAMMRERRFAKESYTAKLIEISRRYGHEGAESAYGRYSQREFKDQVVARAPDVVDFLGEPRANAPFMPLCVVIRRAREAMAQGFEGNAVERCARVSAGWYTNDMSLFVRMMRGPLLVDLVRVDPDVAYWLHPQRADLTALWLAWKDVGGRLIDPTWTKQQVYERIAAHKDVVTSETDDVQLPSRHWLLKGEDSIDPRELNDWTDEERCIDTGLRIYRDLNVIFGPHAIGTGGLRDLAHIWNVPLEEIEERLSGESSPIDMRRASQIYASLYEDRMLWYEECADLGRRLGAEYYNVLCEALYEAAVGLVAHGESDAERDRAIVKREVVRYLRAQWQRWQVEMPSRGNDFPLRDSSPLSEPVPTPYEILEKAEHSEDAPNADSLFNLLRTIR